MSSSTRVFVYGSLKRGQSRSSILDNGGGRLLSECTIRGNYAMYDLGAFPAVVQSQDLPTSDISGEVWVISQELLSYLDIIEGHPNFYSRHKILTPHGRAWCYFLPRGAYVNERPLVLGGEWNGPTKLAYK